MRNQLLVISLIAATLIASTSAPAHAGGTWVNNTCQKIAAPESPSDGFEIDYQFAFKTQQRSYLMYAARSMDGAYLFCWSKPGYRSPQVIKHQNLNFPFVNTITQSKKGTPIFSVMIRDGNGRDTTVTPMKLDLTNPQKPIVVPEQCH
ncbi:hypothetical protein C7B65_04005 [Phormidesmis priestleyi ULC007]|uniref:Uncharacterized protein n=1 Tax=Phormidesmis priestleyi ULC007 TaxID=1920490 RepID=A0A2T1DKY6_9CYAN|nr:hypothetical protein [Phormidesmis priestleyi]PSB21115.1 hypothetical protein C7B65_04005 [Phormidesmis priestleyi ULC007]PZO51360.1 MAG: hypothetical protein DCF14_09705 [Phormidesmis priestleyi]